MGTVLLVFGVILLLTGGVLFWFYQRAKKSAGEMGDTETYSVASLQEMSDSIAKEIGAGSFVQACEVKGEIIAKTPLVSEIQQTPCVYYRTLVTQEFREQYFETDQNGNQRSRTRKRTQTVSANTRSVEFAIDDGSGQILVEPNGAKWDEEKVVDNYQPTGLGAMIVGMLGTRYQEWAIPTGRRAYVLGEANDAGGRLSVNKPQKGRLFISLKSEEELTQKAEKSAKIFGILAPIAAGLGLILLISGLVM